METKNDASQTLFRMVSLRNAKLTETKAKNFGFTQRPEQVTGFFDEAVGSNTTPSTKLKVMNEAATLFNTIFKTEKDIESGMYGKLLIVGRKISRKETLSDSDWKFTKDYYSNLINSASKELNNNGINDLTILWDHLIYQVVTQNDFYVKEAISDVLKAIHLGFVQNTEITEEIIRINGEKPLEKALEAKIVLPAVLFKEDFSNTSTLDDNEEISLALSPATEQRLINEGQQQIELNNALVTKEALVKLNAELKQLEKSFFKQRNQVYDKAYAEYKKTNQPIIDAYEKQLEELKVQATKDQQEGRVLQAENLPEIEIPPFEFTYNNEINIEDLKSKLTATSLMLFLDLFATQVETVIDAASKNSQIALQTNQFLLDEKILQFNDELENYNFAINTIEQQIAEQTNIALQVAPLPQEQYINLGGATIPVAQNSARTPFAYATSVGNTLGGSFLNFSFEVENTSWNVASVKILANTDFGHFEETYNNIAVLNNKITVPPSLIGKFKYYPTFKIEIIFANGREAFGQIANITNYNQVFTGMLQLKPVSNNPKSKRKNFGIKRLGVADYLKVVQSVHAYVPGLVSNIENVMASELRHKSSVAREYSEITDTTSKSQETEKVSDTSKTSRTDMQTEVAREIDKQQTITGHTRFNYDSGAYKFEIGAEYANNTAQHDSTRQAVMKSQELTEKAMERVLTKISEERVQKIIKEYTETNVHEFDNRGKVTDTNNPEAAQPKHITGVYRWIDTKYKNQIYNYGIRTMFEFMIPEPARLHRLALAVSKGQILTAPIDPRKADAPWKMPDAKTASKELLQHWADIYKVELTESLPSSKLVMHTAAGSPEDPFRRDFGPDQSHFSIPENYIGKSASLICRSQVAGNRYNSDFFVSNLRGSFIERNNEGSGSVNFDHNEYGLYLTGTINYFVKGYNVRNYTVQVNVNCELTSEYVEKWKTENFNLIIKAYDAAYAKFQEEQAKLDEEQKKKEQEAKDKMGKFYRYMEQDVLKHNCIAYLLQDNPSLLGTSFTTGGKMEKFAVTLNDDLDKYAALAKFIEQAFEWEIMDYTFYPYYWANREKWQEMYISESMDPLFRSFLQSGMAKVIVTVRPGFEAAVQFFLETGLIWNGGEVPVIGDPMYMSIADEMRKPLGKPLGKYWITKLPTTLTILQDKSTGLPVQQPLPIFPEANPANCENPSELETKSSFRTDDAHLDSALGTTSTLLKYLED